MAKSYSPFISLIENGRGVYSLDTIMGCEGGMSIGDKGCYDDCYSAKSAKQYGYDFSKNVKRVFRDKAHEAEIFNSINNIDMPFVRIGSSGDPSGDWEHTIGIMEKLKHIKKEFVVITRHWAIISDSQLERLKAINVTFNTSVSALDSETERNKSIEQFERLKPYCKSVLRIVTCDFNTMNLAGFNLALVQDDLLKIDENYIDTVFRPSSNNKLVKHNVINVEKTKFITSDVLASRLNKKTYFSKCSTCPDMCGASRREKKQKQLKLFRGN